MLVDPITSIGTFFVFAGIAFILYFLMHKRVMILNKKNTYLSIYFNQRVSESINSFRDLFIKGGREFYVNEMRKSKMQLAAYEAEIKFIPNISKYTIEISVILGIAIISVIQFYLFEAYRAIAVISVFLAASTRIAPAIVRLQQNVIVIKSSLSAAKPTFDLIEELKGVEELDRFETVLCTKGPDPCGGTALCKGMKRSGRLAFREPSLHIVVVDDFLLECVRARLRAAHHLDHFCVLLTTTGLQRRHCLLCHGSAYLISL
jgi:ABC-type multidrug transport system fused ATPase/permease subunit